MIGLIWLNWLFNQILVLIILLNFLIAIISQSYDSVMAKSIISRYVNRCTTNREHRLNLKAVGMISYQDIVVVSANCQKSGNEDELEGFVKSIKKYVHKE